MAGSPDLHQCYIKGHQAGGIEVTIDIRDRGAVIVLEDLSMGP